MFGIKKKKYDVDDIKELQKIFTENKKSRNSGNFIESFKEFKEIESSIQANKEAEVQRILEEYNINDSDNNDNDSATNMLLKAIIPRLLMGGKTHVSESITSQKIGTQGQEQQALMPVVSISQEQTLNLIETIKGKIPKKFKPYLSQIHNLSDLDIVNIVRGLS